ncbi:MAG: PilZ domain-containing protein [Planctomycetota bacterium]|jgi:hypothetical protein
MSSEERRAHERTAADLTAEVRLGSGTVLAARIENMGELGVYISTADLDGVIEVGDQVTIAFERDGQSVERTGEVLRHDQEFTGGEIRRAFAVRFVNP